MEGRSVFQCIKELIRKFQIDCVLIGGFAVNVYNYGRQTGDVDFLITREHFNKIISSLEQGGGYQTMLRENFAQLEKSTRLWMDIDFMFVDETTMKKILQDTKEVTIGRQKFLVPSLMHLIALKLHAMKGSMKTRLAKDLMDVLGLIRYNSINIKSKEFKEACLKYGNEEIYQKIKELSS